MEGRLGSAVWSAGPRAVHRLHDEFRRLKERTDIEDAIIGHSSEGSRPGYGEYAIIDMLGPAIEKTRSPFDVVDGKREIPVRAA